MKYRNLSMKLAIVSETYSPEVNGVALTVASLVENLSQLGFACGAIEPFAERLELVCSGR